MCGISGGKLSGKRPAVNLRSHSADGFAAEPFADPISAEVGDWQGAC